MEAENKLLEEIEKLQLSLDRKTLRGGSEVFEQLYQFVIKVQAQVSIHCFCHVYDCQVCV